MDVLLAIKFEDNRLIQVCWIRLLYWGGLGLWNNNRTHCWQAKVELCGLGATAPASVKTIRWRRKIALWLIVRSQSTNCAIVLGTYPEDAQMCLRLFPCRIRGIWEAVVESCLVIVFTAGASLLARPLAAAVNSTSCFLLPPLEITTTRRRAAPQRRTRVSTTVR